MNVLIEFGIYVLAWLCIDIIGDELFVVAFYDRTLLCIFGYFFIGWLSFVC